MAEQSLTASVLVWGQDEILRLYIVLLMFKEYSNDTAHAIRIQQFEVASAPVSVCLSSKSRSAHFLSLLLSSLTLSIVSSLPAFINTPAFLR